MGKALGTVGRILVMATAGGALLVGTAVTFHWSEREPAVTARASCPKSAPRVRDVVKTHRSGPRHFFFRMHRV